MWASAGSAHTAWRVHSPFAGKVARSRPSTALPNAIAAVGNGEDVLPERVAGPEGLHRGEVGAPARLDGVVRCVRRLGRATAAACALARRATTFHAATGIAAASAASATMAFVLIERVRMMYLGIAIQVRHAKRRAATAAMFGGEAVLGRRSREDLHVIGAARPVNRVAGAHLGEVRVEDVRTMTA